jgi:multicomponent Na+:H+ antiporter subunit D
MENLLPLFIAIPMGAAFLLPLLEKLPIGPKVSQWLALLVSLVVLLMSLYSMGASESTYWMGGWSPAKGAIGISLVLDSLSRLMLVVIALITFAATIFSIRYMNQYTSEPLYYCLFFLMVTGMNGVVLAGDIFNVYVFLEVAAIASYSLVAFGCGSEELEAAFKYLVLGTISSAFILLGIAVLYNQTGQLNIAAISAALPKSNPAILMAAAFFLMGFGLKSAMVPFHAWLPDAHPSAPAPISAMLSGVLIKALGVYTLIRIFFDCLSMSHTFAYVLMTLGVVSMVIGVFLAVGQWDFKRLLAYHSISQMGYVVLAVGVAGEMLITKRYEIASLALLGGLFHLFNHAVFKSLLFLCSGAVEYRTGTRLLKKLGGLKHKMPVTGACLRVAALSISGVPPFNGFWSKLIIIIAVIQSGHYGLGAVTVLVSFMTLLSFIKVQRYIVDGDPSEAVAPVQEAPLSMCVAMILLAVICVGAGILFPFMKDTLFESSQTMTSQSIIIVKNIISGG